MSRRASGVGLRSRDRRSNWFHHRIPALRQSIVGSLRVRHARIDRRGMYSAALSLMYDVYSWHKLLGWSTLRGKTCLPVGFITLQPAARTGSGKPARRGFRRQSIELYRTYMDRISLARADFFDEIPSTIRADVLN